MKVKRDLKGLLPIVRKEMAKGRDKEEIFSKLNLDQGQRNNINSYLRKDQPIKDPDETLIIRPERKRRPEYVFFNGKRYRDITADFIDCGG